MSKKELLKIFERAVFIFVFKASKISILILSQNFLKKRFRFSAIEDYSNNENFDTNAIHDFILNQNDESFRLKSVSISQSNAVEHNFYTNAKILIQIDYTIIESVLGLRIGFDLIDSNSGTVIFRSFHDDTENEIKIMKKGNYSSTVVIPENLLISGSFALKLAIGIHNKRWIAHDDSLILKFTLSDVGGLNSAFTDSRPGVIMPKLIWQNDDN